MPGKIFSARKLPGWALIILGAVWRAADHFGRIDVLYHVFETLGGSIQMLAAVIASPVFSGALVAIGVAYLVFVGEPEPGVQRHPWWPVIGWAVFGICLTAILVTTGYGALEVYVANESARRAQAAMFWHLTPEQKEKMAAVIDATPETEKFPFRIEAVQSNTSALVMQEDIALLFTEHKWTIQKLVDFDVRADLVGLCIAVAPKFGGEPGGKVFVNTLPAKAQAIFHVFYAAGISPCISGAPGVQDDDAALMVGMKPFQ